MAKAAPAEHDEGAASAPRFLDQHLGQSLRREQEMARHGLLRGQPSLPLVLLVRCLGLSELLVSSVHLQVAA